MISVTSRGVTYPARPPLGRPGSTVDAANDGLRYQDITDKNVDLTHLSLLRLGIEGETSTERCVADVAGMMSVVKLTTANALRCNLVALKALAGGVGGQCMVALAKIGLESINQCDESRDQRLAGLVYLKGVSACGQHNARVVAETTSAIGFLPALGDKSATVVEKIALGQLRKGLPHSAALSLASVGYQASKEVGSKRDARQLGYHFLDSVAKNADSGEQSQAAMDALRLSKQAFSDEVAVELQQNALGWLVSR